MNSLIDRIEEDTRCLWEALTKYRKGDNGYDPLVAIDCYYRLRQMLAEYATARGPEMDECSLWFSLRVLESFEELSMAAVA